MKSMRTPPPVGIALLLSAWPAGLRAQPRPADSNAPALYLDPAQPIEKRIDDLIAHLDLREKGEMLCTTAPAIDRLRMFTYAIQRGINLKLLDAKEYGPVAAKGYRGIVANATINAEGLVDIYSACDGVCVQASYADYVNYKRKVNAKEAVAGFLWATAIIERPQLEAARKK